MHKAFLTAGKLFGEATKNVTKAPGWVPLGMLFYVAILWSFDEGKEIQGIDVRKNIEVLTVVLTATFYTFGDIIDDWVFDPMMKSRLVEAQDLAKKALGIPSGIYAVSKSIAVAAKKYQGTRIQIRNEAAKVARSIAAFTLVAAGVLVMKEFYLWAAVTGLCTMLLFFAYVNLKASHMRMLYKLVSEKLSKDEKRYGIHDLPAIDSRLFFWKGVLVASASTKLFDGD